MRCHDLGVRLTIALWLLDAVLAVVLGWLIVLTHEKDIVIVAIFAGPPVLGALLGPVFADAPPGRRVRASACGMLVGFAGTAATYGVLILLFSLVLPGTAPSVPSNN